MMIFFGRVMTPLIGGVIGGLLYKMLGADTFPKPNIEGE